MVHRKMIFRHESAHGAAAEVFYRVCSIVLVVSTISRALCTILDEKCGAHEKIQELCMLKYTVSSRQY